MKRDNILRLSSIDVTQFQISKIRKDKKILHEDLVSQLIIENITQLNKLIIIC